MIIAFAGIAVRDDLKEVKDFEKEFHELFNDPKDEAKAEKQLEETEASIEKENEAFKEGKAEFSEKLNEFSDLSKEEFEKEKEGLKMPTELRITLSRATGLIMPNPEDVTLSEEQRAYLDQVYSRADIPATYDARTKS